MKVFIVPGYGLRKDVLSDETYIKYLSIVFKYVKTFSEKHPKTKIVIIFSGGRSDLFKPYKRTEAGEMKKLFLTYKLNPKWKLKTEKRSLSSLENQVYSKQIVDKLKGENKEIYMFGERTRIPRLKITAKKVFGKASLIPVDLYTKEQLKDIVLMKKKEKSQIKLTLWALENKKNFEETHKLFVKKFRLLRKYGVEKQEEIIKKIWQETVSKFESGKLSAG